MLEGTMNLGPHMAKIIVDKEKPILAQKSTKNENFKKSSFGMF